MNSNLISIGYSTPAILKSRLNVNVDYSDTDDNTSINLLWSVPLSDSVEPAQNVVEKETISLNLMTFKHRWKLSTYTIAI
ncbi:hypothetical protein ACVSD9_24525 [Vibrio parahaemolyticus]